MEETTSSYKLEVLTPKGLIWEGNCSAVSIPAIASLDNGITQGQIEFLPSHIAYQGIVGSGILSLKSSDDNGVDRLAVFGGFAVFERSSEGDKLKILADDVVTQSSLDQNNYSNDRASLKATINSKTVTEFEKQSAEKELRKIEIIDGLISH